MSVRVKNWMGEAVYLGPSKAIVIDNKDPSKKGRIRVKSPVFGDTAFIHYVYPDDGFFGPPDVGSIVYIVPDGGDPDFLIAWATINDGDRVNPDTRLQFRRDVPTNRGWASPGDLEGSGKPIGVNAGHLFEMDDGIAMVASNGTVTHTKEKKGIRFTTSGGHFLKMLEEETAGATQNRVELGSIGGHKFSLYDEASRSSKLQRAEISTTGGQFLSLIDDADSVKQQVILRDVDNRTIEIIKESDRIRIRNSAGTIFIDIDFANDIIEIDANNVKIGTAAAEALVRGDTFRTLFNAHFHQTGTGPTSPPVVPMDPSSANTHLSSHHTVE